jgi:prephenate dehydratase
MADTGAPAAKRAKHDDEGATELDAVYTGGECSFTHLAIERFFQHMPSAKLQGVKNSKVVFETVGAGNALYGVVPFENSASGTLHSIIDLLIKHNLVIGGELGVREVYCLCAKPGVRLSGVNRVMSHSNILEACSTFLEKRLAGEVTTLPTSSTTEASQQVASSVDSPGLAAIVRKEAALKNGLEVLAEDIGNDVFLETRYILVHQCVGPASTATPPFPHDVVSVLKKRSACFALRNEPGAVFKLLSCWALRNIDILKVETRPVSSAHPSWSGNGTPRLWDNLFYVEYAVPLDQTAESSTRLWEALKEFSCWQQDFGTYSSQLTKAEKIPSTTWSDMVDLMAK